jgi:hypothetical protein
MQSGWLALVEDYSGRHLAEPGEKLTAIAGAARIIAEQTGDEYLAGLWRSHIFEDLFWRARCTGSEDVSMRTSGDNNASQTQQYRAPSWSWAAIDTPVQFVSLTQETLAQVVGCHTKAAGLDPYGAVSDGELKLLVSIASSARYAPY